MYHATQSHNNYVLQRSTRRQAAQSKQWLDDLLEWNLLGATENPNTMSIVRP